MIAKKCLVCGKDFSVKPSLENQLYCSRKCHGLSRRSLMSNTCPSCGKSFTDIPSKMKNRKYCGLICAAQNRPPLTEETKALQRDAALRRWSSPQSDAARQHLSRWFTKTTAEFVSQAIAIHGPRYDYSKANYVNSYTDVEIICREHGVFTQTPNNHVNGRTGCPQCFYDSRRLSVDQFILDAREVHGDRFDYSKSVYENAHVKLIIICREHGEFLQTPQSHIHGEHGCSKCYGHDLLSRDEFIDRSVSIHGSKYDYSLVDYKGANTKVAICCPVHGVFHQRPASHYWLELGCAKCIGNWQSGLTTQEFVNRSLVAHGDKYDYSRSVYTKCHEKVIIVCPEHGEFKQQAGHHMRGHGCCLCRESRGERKIAEILKRYGVSYLREHRFESCRMTYGLPFDFVIRGGKPRIIEFHGEQHYYPITFGCRDPKVVHKAFIEVQKRDVFKEQWAAKKGLDLLIVPYWEFKRLEEIVDGFLLRKSIPPSEDVPKLVKKYAMIRDKIRRRYA